MSHILRVLGTLPLLAASLGPADAAQIQLNSGSPYKCITVENGDTANGTPVILYSCSGGREDLWNYVDGQLQGIGTANGVAMCLDVKGAGIAAGTLVDLWPCNGQQNQQWEIEEGVIFAAQSGMCLDGSGGPKVGGGTQLVINTCEGQASQWIVRGMQLELSANSPYVCVNVKGNDTANDTPVITYSCGDSPNELWNYGGDGQFYGLGTNNGKYTCLTASGLTAGSLVNLSSCVANTATSNNQWVIFSGAFLGLPSANEIVLLGAGLCLDSSGGPSLGGGTQLVVNPCSGAGSQNWIGR